MAKRKNIYSHEIDLKKIQIKNAPASDFAKELEKSHIEVMKLKTFLMEERL